MSIGETIRRMRIVMGLSQVELAEKIGVSKQTLYKYEQGIITNIPSDKIELIAKTLGTTPARIMGWESDGVHHLSAYYFRLLNIMSGINDEGLKRLLQYAEDIQDKYKKGEDNAEEVQ